MRIRNTVPNIWEQEGEMEILFPTFGKENGNGKWQPISQNIVKITRKIFNSSKTLHILRAMVAKKVPFKVWRPILDFLIKTTQRIH